MEIETEPTPGAQKAAESKDQSRYRQSARISELKKLEEARNNEEEKKMVAAMERADEERRKFHENIKEGMIFIEFMENMAVEYLTLPPKRQRMFRISAIMLLNEMLDEQEMEEKMACTANTIACPTLVPS